MARIIEHEILAPDGFPLIVASSARVKSGETIQAFIRRNGWHFVLPTRCFVNGEVIRPEDLTKRRVRVRDDIRFVSRPGRGGSSGSPSTAKSIGSIVAMVALAALSYGAGGAIAGAVGLSTGTLAGVSYSTIFSGLIDDARTLLPHDFQHQEARPR